MPRREEDRELLRSFGELANYVCPVHFQDREETKAHREMVCGKIKDKADASDVRELQDAIKGLVPRWVIGIFSIAIIASFGFISSRIEKGQDEIKSSLTTIHRRISETANDSDVIRDMVRDVQKQQAILDTKLHNIEQRLEKK